MSRLVRVPWLVVAWVALWGRLSVGNVASGILVAVALVTLVPVRGSPPPRYVVRPWAMVRFVAYFTRELIRSNVVLAREALSRRDRIRTGVIEVRLVGVSDGVLTFVANMTALAPGTMTVEVERRPATFYVHVLHLRDIEVVREDILTLERLAILAFGSSEAVAALRAAEAAALRAAEASGSAAGHAPGSAAAPTPDGADRP